MKYYIMSVIFIAILYSKGITPGVTTLSRWNRNITPLFFGTVVLYGFCTLDLALWSSTKKQGGGVESCLKVYLRSIVWSDLIESYLLFFSFRFDWVIVTRPFWWGQQKTSNLLRQLHGHRKYQDKRIYSRSEQARFLESFLKLYRQLFNAEMWNALEYYLGFRKPPFGDKHWAICRSF